MIRRVPEQDLGGLEVPPGAGQIKRRLMPRVHAQALEARVEGEEQPDARRRARVRREVDRFRAVAVGRRRRCNRDQALVM